MAFRTVVSLGFYKDLQSRSQLQSPGVKQNEIAVTRYATLPSKEGGNAETMSNLNSGNKTHLVYEWSLINNTDYATPARCRLNH